ADLFRLERETGESPAPESAAQDVDVRKAEAAELLRHQGAVPLAVGAAVGDHAMRWIETERRYRLGHALGVEPQGAGDAVGTGPVEQRVADVEQHDRCAALAQA